MRNIGFRTYARLAGAVAMLALAAASPLQASASSASITTPTRQAVNASARQVVSDSGETLNSGCLWDCAYVKSGTVKLVSKPIYNISGAYTYAYGPGKLTLQLASTTTNGYTATVGISAAGVSAGVGFNTSQSYTLSQSFSIDVPAGLCYALQGTVMFYDYTFDVWTQQFIGSDYKVGTGRAWVYKGVGFTQIHHC
jgi:hypothetical protein